MGPQQYSNQMNFQPQANPQDEKFKKLAMIAIIIGVLGAVIFAASIIFGGDDTKALVAKSIAYNQEELRIVELTSDFDSDDIQLERFIANAKTLVVSDQVSMQVLYGDEIKDKVFLAISDVEAEARLEEASQINDLDSEFKKTMSKVISEHLVVLRTLSKSKSPELKETSQIAIGNREQLLTQLEEL